MHALGQLECEQFIFDLLSAPLQLSWELDGPLRVMPAGHVSRTATTGTVLVSVVARTRPDLSDYAHPAMPASLRPPLGLTTRVTIPTASSGNM